VLDHNGYGNGYGYNDGDGCGCRRQDGDVYGDGDGYGDRIGGGRSCSFDNNFGDGVLGNGFGGGYGHALYYTHVDAPYFTPLVIDTDPITTAYQFVTMQTQGGINAYH